MYTWFSSLDLQLVCFSFFTAGPSVALVAFSNAEWSVVRVGRGDSKAEKRLTVICLVFRYYNVNVYKRFILIYDISLSYRKLAYMGFDPTTWSLPCTYSNHWSVWPSNEMCLMVERIKWARSLTHRQTDCRWRVWMILEFRYSLYFHLHTEIILGYWLHQSLH